MQGIAGGLDILGKGEVQYQVLDHLGRIKTISGTAWHIPKLPCRLIPPQVVMSDSNKGSFTVTGHTAYFTYTADGGKVATPLDPRTNLPTITLFKDAHSAALKLHTALYSCVTQDSNQNLTPTQKNILRWHWRLGHTSMAKLHWLSHRGLLRPLSTTWKFSDAPMCATCNYGKQTRRPTGTTTTTVPHDKHGTLKTDKLSPGDEIACDQFETQQLGRLFSSGGREKDNERYRGGTIFVDTATGFTRVYFQVTLSGSETIKSKRRFEQDARAHGVIIKAYRTDNGIFTKEQFLNELDSQDQTITLSGVGAHHQNGIAERNIRTIVTMAHTMLLHAQLRWTDQTSSNLWPMAMQHASYISNIMPNMHDGLSPDEKFSGSLHRTDKLKQLPVWGCPTYVLQPTLQDGRKLPKWQPRSRRAQYMGWSPRYASNIALVRNLITGQISPQFHVVFDNWFETVDRHDENNPPEAFDVMITSSQFEANVDPDEIPRDLSDEWLTKEELLQRRLEQERSRPSQTPAQSMPQNTPHITEPSTTDALSEGVEATLPTNFTEPATPATPKTRTETSNKLITSAPTTTETTTTSAPPVKILRRKIYFGQRIRAAE